MNKVLKLFIVCLAVFCLTGCRKNYLTCESFPADNENLKVKKTIKLGFQRGELVESRLYHDYFFKKLTEEDINSLKQSLNEEQSRFKDIKGVTVRINDFDNGVSFDLIIDVEKISDKDAEQFEELLNYKSFTDAEAKLRNSYACK